MQISAIARITFRLYLKALVVAFRQTLKSWKIILLQALGLLPLAVLPFLLKPVGGLVASVILGLSLTYYLSYYLVLIRHGLEGEKIDKESLISETNQLFSPAISVMFFVFVVNFTFGFLGSSFFKAVIGILMAVFLNPLPEVLYARSSSLLDMLSDSFQFIRENGVEWFIPTLIPFLIFVGPSPDILFQVLSFSPVTNLKYAFFYLSQGLLSPAFIFILVLVLYIMFFLMIFRGVLFQSLLTGRRNRLYRDKMSS
ncbi:MAG TPA: hypothetical protein PKA63_11700 [Oligoflexia bacterium]|nr:hypothetical protein [Oligoflexia bacterium]HMP49318.1 hypothetical protein [Oligoflexia bacterium]